MHKHLVVLLCNMHKTGALLVLCNVHKKIDVWASKIVQYVQNKCSVSIVQCAQKN